MSMTAISVQVDSKDKEEATKILQKLGVSMSGLINMTLKQVIINEGIPFEIKTTKISRKMKRALKELEYIETHLDEYEDNNWEDLRKELSLDDEKV